MRYITREGGATVTVFVPYDCGNHCPFCINKAEYENTNGFSVKKIIKSINKMNKITPYCDFVFTGGEPLSNLEELQKMLDVIPNTHKVFINTTLPVNEKYTERDIANFLNKNYKEGKITGVNVSRHLLGRYVKECNDEIFSMLDFKVRINCVLYDTGISSTELLRKFVDRFSKITSHIQFRKDYVVTTPENLYDEENDNILKLLSNAFGHYNKFGQYRMRCGYSFNYKGYKVTYHKTLPYSKIKLNSLGKKPVYVLYDIIIKQNGVIRDDWDICSKNYYRKTDLIAHKLNMRAYKKVVYEDYK